MIVGHGIDLQDMEHLERAIRRQPKLVAKILTATELEHYQNLSAKRALSYLAGRWAGKEAFAKAYGTGIVAGCLFQDMEILADHRGRPIFTRSPFKGRVHVSISHSGHYVQASVILEGEEDDF